jgi:UDP-glucose 4-epimerase
LRVARILVTGGAGYIGSHTVRELTRAGHEVTVYDDLTNGHREAIDGEIALVLGELRGSRLEEVFSNWQPDAVIHFAGAIEPGFSAKEPSRFYGSNVAGTIALADQLARLGTPCVFSSSCAVYGTPEKSPVQEQTERHPDSLYGETKVIGEDIFGAYDTAYGLRHIALRYFNAAGADPTGDNGADHRHRVHLITVACLAALGLVPELPIFGTDYPTPDGTCLRDYVHVCDLAVAHVLAVEALLDGSPSRTYNVGLGVPHSVREVVTVVESVSGESVPTRIGERRPGDPSAIWADGSLIRTELNWTPTLSSIETIVATAWQWHRTHPNGFTTLRVVES